MLNSLTAKIVSFLKSLGCGEVNLILSRPGTVAFNMKDQFVEKKVIDKRFQFLKNTQTDISERKLKRFVGTEQFLLIEKLSKKNKQIYSGKINSGQITHIDKGNLNLGDFVKVKIVDSTPFYLKAEQI